MRKPNTIEQQHMITPAQFLEMQARVAPKGQPDPKPSAAVERESKLHDEIMRHCDNQWPRWRYIHSRMDRASTVGLGAPDFVIAIPGGRTLWIEVKSRCGKLSREQMGWQMLMAQLGHKLHLVRSMAEFLELVK